jgi:hypothetical protein
MTSKLLRNKFQALVGKERKQTKNSNTFAFRQKVSLIEKLLGCKHGNLSRPFSSNETAYRSCLNCGARKQFNTDTLETYGNFYFPPVIKAEMVNEI